MKITKISLISLAAAMAFTACDNEEVERFNPTFEALNIGFGSANNLTQESTFNYSETTTERPVTFYARVTGMAADRDRTFTLEAVGGDIDKAGQSYRFDTYVMPAGAITGEYRIYFDPAKLPAGAFTGEDGEIVFRVAANDSFAAGALNQNELRFTLKNYLAMPDDWNAPVYGNQPISRYFGVYSPEKFRFMIEQGCPVNFCINYSQGTATTIDGDRTVFSGGYAEFLKQSYQLALEEYNKTHDTPLCDSLGNPITF